MSSGQPDRFQKHGSLEPKPCEGQWLRQHRGKGLPGPPLSRRPLEPGPGVSVPSLAWEGRPPPRDGPLSLGPRGSPVLRGWTPNLGLCPDLVLKQWPGLLPEGPDLHVKNFIHPFPSTPPPSPIPLSHLSVIARVTNGPGLLKRRVSRDTRLYFKAGES